MSDSEAAAEEPRAFDTFELCTALLLGITAVCAAISGQQAGQWGGKQLDAFSSANSLTTKASTQYNEDTVIMNADYAVVARAKEHLLEAKGAKDPDAKARHLEMASYFYTTNLSHDGYEAMGLPAKYYVPDPDEQKAAGKTRPTTEVEEDIPEAALMASLHEELDHAYAKEMLATGQKMFADADAKFAEGRVANENGDAFQLVNVFYTVALFFAGLGLVFKTKLRWGFFGMGTLIFLWSFLRMLRLNWTS